MKLIPPASVRLLIAFVACGLASCSLPPEAAWRVIHTDGLLPLMAMEMGARPYPPGLLSNTSRPTAPVPTAPVPMASNTYLAAPDERVRPVAYEVPNDVVEFVQPKSLPARPDAPQFDNDTPRPPRPNLITKRRLDSSPAASEETEPEHKPTVIATARPKPEPDVVVESRKDVAEVPAPSASKPMSTGAQAPAKAEENTLPYGTPIPGRPGLVNSPYAAKNQFVDVAGLKPGQEVKCPYSGKLFLVPPGAQAGAATTKPEGAAKPEENKQ